MADDNLAKCRKPLPIMAVEPYATHHWNPQNTGIHCYFYKLICTAKGGDTTAI